MLYILIWSGYCATHSLTGENILINIFYFLHKNDAEKRKNLRKRQNIGSLSTLVEQLG